MERIKYLVVSALLLLVVFSCSTRKDAFLNRNFHAMNSKYNILYNGYLAYDEGIKDIEGNYKDNFWKRLPIEALNFDDSEVIVPKFIGNKGAEANSKATLFDRSEEKAVKAIQKHGMNIGGYEKNSQIDEAYLLLGKSRYYTQRFIPAIEAFNYIIANYPNANLNYETRVWRAKSNIRLGNDGLAIETMSLLLNVLDEKENVPLRIIEDARTAMAMAYAENDSITKLVYYLKEATKTSYNKEQTGRNLFILGQVYTELNQPDSARTVFNKLINNRKLPSKYRIHANIELAKAYPNDSLSVPLIKKIKKLIRNTDNRKYYDELYYQVGALYEGNKDKENAIKFYSKSLRQNGSDYQKTYTYERLGNLSFKDKDYLLAQSYYDSVAQIVPNENRSEKRIRRIKRMNKGLVLLKGHETTLKENDSVLRLVKMTAVERGEYFTKYIKSIKKEDELRRQQLANSVNFKGGVSSFGASRGDWYFYSEQSKQLGSLEFKRVWGDLKLQDNWRWSDQSTLSSEQDDDQDSTKEKVSSRYELSTYLNSIPTEPKLIELLKQDRNKALYKSGLIYKEQFKNIDLAIVKLERLNTLPVGEDLKLPLNYHLHQLYKSKGLFGKASTCRSFIVDGYPDSQYANLLDTSSIVKKNVGKQDEVAKKYKEFYDLYNKQEYEVVIQGIDGYLLQNLKSNLTPKFKLLKALSVGKVASKEEFLKLLQLIVSNYSETLESERAKELIKILKK